MTTTTESPVGTWALDPAHTEVGFTVRHIMSKVRGVFTDFDGSIVVGENGLADAQASANIRLASVDTRSEDRDNHLRSADFFAVDANPTMAFSSTNVKYNGGDQLVVSGDLTINGVTRSVDLDVEYLGQGGDPFGNNRIGFEATGEISRRDFGIDFNIPLEGDRMMIGDRIAIRITGEAVQQS
ncbi:MAG: YceI family protein [Nocardioidaceae bacterium]